MPADCARITVSDVVRVPLPPDQAFELFTPTGESRWAPGWRPRFLVPTEDDSVPGTTFEIQHGDRTSIWMVVHREPVRLIEYSWIIPGERAAVVAVSCEPADDGSTVATVTYHMTGLVPEMTAEVERFATGYRQFLDYWQTAMGATAKHG